MKVYVLIRQYRDEGVVAIYSNIKQAEHNKKILGEALKDIYNYVIEEHEVIE